MRGYPSSWKDSFESSITHRQLTSSVILILGLIRDLGLIRFLVGIRDLRLGEGMMLILILIFFFIFSMLGVPVLVVIGILLLIIRSVIRSVILR